MNNLLRCGKILLLLMLALALALPGVVAAQPRDLGSQNERPTVKPRTGDKAVPGELIVKFKENTGPVAQAAVRRQEGLEKKKEFDLIDAELVKVRGQSVEQAVRGLEARAEVEYATPNRKIYRTGFADEPLFAELWGLHNTGQTINGSPGTPNVDINGKEASTRMQGSSNLKVAVIDDGVDFTHPDLSARKWVNPGETPGNGIDDDGNGYVDDVNGWDVCHQDNTVHDSGDDAHGTHVSGTIAASVNNQGIVGVAPNIKIMAVKFLSDGGTGSGCNSLAGALEAIQYAKTEGAKISNNSWGYFGAPDPALKDAIDNSGQLFVAAAGNNAANNDALNPANYPASYSSPNILAVAAANNQGSLASFSAFGKNTVDISAPGVSILSSVPGTPDIPAVTLSSVGSSGGKAVTAGYGADEIGDATKRASFFTKAFQAVNRGSQQVVLVDDDASDAGFPDVGPTLFTAIQSATGSAPQVINVSTGDGPSLSQLSGKTVVWATGQACDSDGGNTCFFGGSSTTLTANDQSTLSSFLSGGGKLVITGMDALYLIESSSFVTSTLNLSMVSDVGGATFQGSSGTAFAGESYTLNSSTAIEPFHDDVSPANNSTVTQGVYPGTPSGWESWDGTSMATPHVTGTAALVASKYPSLLSQSTAIKKIIMDTGKPLSATAGKTVTGDMANAQAALFPRVTATNPAAGKTGVSRGANVTATFSDAMKAITVNGTTFWLVKNGTTAKISATVTYNATTKKATLNPSANLAANTLYKATVKGGSTGVKNTSGDPMFQSKVWTFKTGS